MALSARARQQYAERSFTSPVLEAPAGEHWIVARLPDHDWAGQPLDLVLEETTDLGLSWQPLLVATGAEPGEVDGALWLERDDDWSDAPRTYRLRVENAGPPLTAAIELESLPGARREPAHQSIGHVQYVRGNVASGSILAITITATVAGNTLICAGGWSSNATVAFDADPGNVAPTHTVFGRTSNGTTLNASLVAWHSIAANLTTVTVDPGGTGGINGHVLEKSGCHATSGSLLDTAADTTGTQTGGTNASITSAAAPSAAGELFVYYVNNAAGATATLDADYTRRSPDAANRDHLYDRVGPPTSGTDTVTVTLGAATNSVMLLGCFHEAAAVATRPFYTTTWRRRAVV